MLAGSTEHFSSKPKHTPPHDWGMFVWQSQHLQASSSLCGTMEFYSRCISVLIYTSSLAHASPSPRVKAVHTRPIKLQSHRVIWCLLCCQPSLTITGSVGSFQAAGSSRMRKRRRCRGVLLGHVTKFDLQVSLEGAQPQLNRLQSDQVSPVTCVRIG